MPKKPILHVIKTRLTLKHDPKDLIATYLARLTCVILIPCLLLNVCGNLIQLG